MNRRLFPALAALALSAALTPIALLGAARPALAAASQPIGAVAMMAGKTVTGKTVTGKTVTGTIPYGERTFRPADRTLTCIVVFAKPSPGTRVKTEWIAVDAGGMKNVKFNEDELVMNGQDNARMFTFIMSNPWPAGKYLVRIYKDSKFDRTIAFNIK